MWNSIRNLLGLGGAGQGGGGRSRSASPLSEQQFLDLLAPAGIDWRLTTAEVAERCGSSNYYNWVDVAYLPPTTALTPFPLRFHVPLREDAWDDCVRTYSADFNDHRNARHNFDAVAGGVSAVLGPGERGQSSNCHGMSWTIGTISVRVHAWPPELNQRTRNVIWEADPDSRHMATIHVESAVPRWPADESLSRVAALPASDRLDLAALHPSIADGAFDWSVGPGVFSARPNPPGLELFDGATPLIWRDAGSARVGITVRAATLPLQADRLIMLQSFVASRARGLGYAMLSLRHNTSLGKPRTLTLATGGPSSGEAIERLASELGRFWNVPTERSYGIDD